MDPAHRPRMAKRKYSPERQQLLEQQIRKYFHRYAQIGRVQSRIQFGMHSPEQRTRWH